MDCSGCSKTETVIPLEILLSHAYLWSIKVMCEFIHEARKVIREAPKSQQENHPQGGQPKEDPFQVFVERLDKKARVEGVLGPTENWKNVLDTHSKQSGDMDMKHFAILTTIYETTGKESKERTPKWVRDGSLKEVTSVVYLLKIIRDRIEHPGTKCNELGWLVDGCLNTEKMLQFLIDRFPKLLPFLWVEFYFIYKRQPTATSKLKQFYPCEIEPYMDYFSSDLSRFQSQLGAALQANLNYGGLVSRYVSSEAPTINAELSTISTISSNIMSINCTMITISEHSLVIEWKEETNQKLCYFMLPETSLHQVNETTLIITHGDFSQCVEICLETPGEKKIRTIKNPSTITVIVSNCNEEKHERIFKSLFEDTSKLSTAFRENPLKWTDLSSSAKQMVWEQGKVILGGGSSVKLKDIIRFDINGENPIFSLLNSKTLQEILRGGNAKLLQKLDVPSKREIYIERIIVPYENYTPNDNCTRAYDVSRLLFFDTVEGRIEFDPTTRIPKFTKNSASEITEKSASQITANSASQITENSASQITENSASQITANSAFQITENSALKTAGASIFEITGNYTTGITESKFIENVLSHNSYNRIIFLAGSPGIGKTCLLENVALRLISVSNNIYVAFIYFKDLIRKIDEFKTNQSTEVDVAVLKRVIVELVCNDEIDKALVKHWLEGTHVRIYLLLDGFDEVIQPCIKLAHDTLTLLSNGLPSVWVIISVRSHLMNTISTLTNYATAFKLQPLSKHEHLSYLKQHFKLPYQSTCKKSIKEPTEKDFTTLANTYLDSVTAHEIENKISENPLQLRIIAEIIEKLIQQRNFSPTLNPVTNYVQICDQIFDTKFEIYLREKEGCSEINMNSPIAKRKKEEMELYHAYCAIGYLFSGIVANYLKPCFAAFNENDWATNVEQLGYVETLAPLCFDYHVFSEYFVAKFVYKVLTEQYQYITPKLPKWNKQSPYSFIERFIILITSKFKNYLICPEICRFLNTFCESSKEIQRHSSKLAAFLPEIQTYYFKGDHNVTVQTYKFLLQEKLENLCVLLCFHCRKHTAYLVEEAISNLNVDFFTYILESIDSKIFFDENMHWVVKLPTVLASALILLYDKWKNSATINECIALGEKLCNQFLEILVSRVPDILKQKNSFGKTAWKELLEKSRYRHRDFLAKLKLVYKKYGANFYFKNTPRFPVKVRYGLSVVFNVINIILLLTFVVAVVLDKFPSWVVMLTGNKLAPT